MKKRGLSANVTENKHLPICLAPCWRLQGRAGVGAGPVLAGRSTSTPGSEEKQAGAAFPRAKWGERFPRN